MSHCTECGKRMLDSEARLSEACGRCRKKHEAMFRVRRLYGPTSAHTAGQGVPARKFRGITGE